MNTAVSVGEPLYVLQNILHFKNIYIVHKHTLGTIVGTPTFGNSDKVFYAL